MKITVGSYEINGEFGSEKEARETFLSHFPAVTMKDLDRVLKAKTFKNGTDKPDDAKIENTDSDKQHTKTGKRVAGGK